MYDIDKTVEYLSKLRLQYIISESAYGEIWRISKTYTPKQLQQKIQQLPAEFILGTIYSQWQEVESLRKQNAFTYQLMEKL